MPLFPGDASPRGRHAGRYDPSTSRLRKTLRIVLILVLLFILTWPFMEPRMLETETVTLVSDDLPADIGQLRVVYVSDIHLGSCGFDEGRLKELVSRINACNADLVLLGGDYAQDSRASVEFFLKLPRIHARYGVFGVAGNHDRTVPESNLTQLRNAMRNAGVTPLVNDAARVRIGAHDIYIAGVDDISNGHPDVQGVAGRLNAEDYVIFLCHDPSVIPEALNATDAKQRINWFDLGLFGHTHGGQIPLLESILDRDSVPNEYMSGWLRRNRIDMLVSRGVGTTGLPVRLFCKPQMHLITIQSGK